MSTPEKKPDGELWIGLAEVTQTSNPGVLGTSEGAFTNAIARAVSKNSFRSTVKDAVAELGLRLARLESAETLTARLAEYSLDAELTKVADEAKKTGRVEFGTFHAFGGDEAAETPPLSIRE
jgi:hypothetical protein